MTKLPFSHAQKTVEPSMFGSSSLFAQNCDKMNLLDFGDIIASCRKCKRLL
jgi:hypothetical protein